MRELAMLPRGVRTACVFFDTPAAACEARAAARTDHPTIPYGRGRGAVRGMARTLVPPSAAEGWGEVVVVESFTASDALLRRWGAAPAVAAPAGLYKFPRTHHVLDAGGTGVSRDDLLLRGGDVARFVGGRCEVIAEEKVDGANLGARLQSCVQHPAAPRCKALGLTLHTRL